MHFAHEERLMRPHNHPILRSTRPSMMRLPAKQFLKDWLEKHIPGPDMKFAPLIGNTQ